MILTSSVFDWSTRVTDRQTDGRAIAYTRYAIADAVARKNLRKWAWHALKQLAKVTDSWACVTPISSGPPIWRRQASVYISLRRNYNSFNRIRLFYKRDQKAESLVTGCDSLTGKGVVQDKNIRFFERFFHNKRQKPQQITLRNNPNRTYPALVFSYAGPTREKRVSATYNWLSVLWFFL